MARMAFASTLRRGLAERRRVYRCRYCGERYERKKPYCPVCKTRKGTKGHGPPSGAMPF